MPKAIVIIPIYKSEPDSFEAISFKQCIQVLNKHSICILTHEELDISYYTNELDNKGAKYIVEYFHPDYFASTAGYNRLLLSLAFYQRFRKYEYMLIYQLDAYVFRDELDYWCDKGYDYIGAPWFEGFLSNADGNKIWKVGNGGFSLRKVKKFICILNPYFPVFKPKRLIRERFNGKLHSLSDYVKLLAYSIGYKNTINYYIRSNHNNEDYFFAVFLENSWAKLLKPDVILAANFSFEKGPDYLYSLTKKTPFGAHALEKNMYNEFWKKNNLI